MKDEDIEIRYLRLPGLGVNQSSTAVEVIHLETGVSVKCFEYKSVHKNLKVAKQRLKKEIEN